MKLRALKHRHVAATAYRLARAKAEQLYSEYMHAQAAMDDWYDDWDGESGRRDITCSECSGTGGDRWNDFITPCQFCDGEGVRWWE